MTNQNSGEEKIVIRVDCRNIREDGNTLVRLLSDFDPVKEEGTLENAFESARRSIEARRPNECKASLARCAGEFALVCSNTKNCGLVSQGQIEFYPHG